MKDHYNVIKSLMRTEKSTFLSPLNQYLFMVDKKANKIDIKRAVQGIYKVKVKDVNTIKVRGKKRRVRFKEGRTRDWKKAVVTLKSGYTIEVA